jgi:DNA helicase IV
LSTKDVAQEQAYVSMLYARLDALRKRAAARLPEVLAQTGGPPAQQVERDAATAAALEKIARYDAAEDGLCFGRLDFAAGEDLAGGEDAAAGEPRYIGRMGMLDQDDEFRSLLTDWRAPAAEPFYVATAVAPLGVSRRRHIRTRLRKVTDLDDDVLDLTEVEPGTRTGLTAEAGLMAALNAGRTGRMSDIVATIQADQDRIIRSADEGVLVVQGGPGTGKTAVALHRAAYLLYTHRKQLSRRGVLVLGPNATFLRYISHVLPSLGESSALLATIGTLFPGVTAERPEAAEVAEIKGRRGFAAIVAAAVRDRQVVPPDGLAVRFAGDLVVVPASACLAARAMARGDYRLHNEGQPIFVAAMLDALAAQYADQVTTGVRGGSRLLNPADLGAIRAELWAEDEVRAAIIALWPELTPQRLLTDLYADPARLASAAGQRLSQTELDLLGRAPGDGWTAADVPLLDEVAEWLGVNEAAEKARAQRRRAVEIARAQGVLDILTGSASQELDDDEVAADAGDGWGSGDSFNAADMLSAEFLADRFEERDHRTVAERAADDRAWTFGHVIVDEAQELSPMAWRMLMRRCPSKSMTVLGDIAQTGDLAGADSWQQVLAPHIGDRWRLERLSVNYRTPAEIMAVAVAVRAGLPGDEVPPISVRETGVPPWRAEPTEAELPHALAAAVKREAEAVGDGRVAVIVPPSRVDTARAVVGGQSTVDDPVAVLTVRQAKGLEFDAVIVVDPDAIVAGSPRGHNDLYVALTRPTQRLGVLQPTA